MFGIKRKNNLIVIASLALLGAILVGFVSYNSSKSLSFKTGNSQINFACKPNEFSEIYSLSEKIAIFEKKEVNVPAIAFSKTSTTILGTSNDERWIEVDISEQKLKAWEGSSLFLETSVSTGLPWWPTPTGEFRVGYKVRATKMEGGEGRYYYYLPNVPYVMFFGNNTLSWSRGYGLHGTYWHSDFGTRRSHGCVNLPTPVAERLYYWTGPVMPEGKGVVRADASNLGTKIVIHD